MLTRSGIVASAEGVGGPVYLGAGSSLLGNALVEVSMFGDSITAGNFNYPKASDVWVPEQANRRIDELGRSETTGENLFTGTVVVSSGCVNDSGTFMMTASEADQNPRFLDTSVASLEANKLYRIAGEVENSLCVGKHLAFRYDAADVSDQVVFSDKNAGGFDESTDGYRAASQVVSANYILSKAPTAVKIRVGGEIVASEISGVGVIRNMTVYELTRGIAVYNQGKSGDYASHGLARVGDVTGWSPDLCFVAFGTNDIRNGVTLPTFLGNLEDIAAALVAAGVFPVLATLPPLASDQANYTLVPAWNAAIIAKALEIGAGWWDRWKVLGNGNIDYIEDGRHPTAEGYSLLAASVAARLA